MDSVDSVSLSGVCSSHKGQLIEALRTGGPEGLRSLCSLKSVSEDRFFTLIQTGIPGPLGKQSVDQSKYRLLTPLAVHRLSPTNASQELDLFERAAKLRIRKGGENTRCRVVRLGCGIAQQVAKITLLMLDLSISRQQLEDRAVPVVNASGQKDPE